MRLSASFMGTAGAETTGAGVEPVAAGGEVTSAGAPAGAGDEALATCTGAADGATNVAPIAATSTQTSPRGGRAAHALSFCLQCIRQTPASNLYFLGSISA